MQKYQSFALESFGFEVDTGMISLRYSLDDALFFEETLKIPLPSPSRSFDRFILDRALFALHIIAGVSYWKTCIPKKMEVKSGPLSRNEAHFFHDAYEKGMGEFFFKNDIDFRGLIHFPSHSSNTPQSTVSHKLKTKNSRVLVPIGGGKDSLVTVKLLQQAGFDVTLLRMGGHPIIHETVRMLGLPCLTLERRLDPLLFRLNAEGAWNGHIPISAYLSFASLITAIIHDFDAVILSNERSASIGNVTFKGMEINHQWSKSLEFESMLQGYERESIGSGVSIFSLLRPLSELSIVKIFTEQCSEFLPIATSCNRNWKISQGKRAGRRPLSPLWGEGEGEGESRWCSKCPKCAFVFSLYAAFLSPGKVEAIFGKNLYADRSLLPLYRELLGLERTKPFECVGTPEETAAAFLLARKRGDFKSTAAMEMFGKEALPAIKNPEVTIKEVLTPVTEHLIPEEFLSAMPKS